MRRSKLKYFCEICSKQCRDANGFKCHLDSESHKRERAIFRPNACELIASRSQEFQDQFIAQLAASSSHGWLVANEVYGGIVRDPDHVHLKGTKWESFTDFLTDLESQNLVQLRPDVRKPSTFEILRIDREKEEAQQAQETAERRKRERDRLRVEQEEIKRFKIVAATSSDGFSEPSILTTSFGERAKIQINLSTGNGKRSFTETSIGINHSIFAQCVVKINYGEFTGQKALVLSEEGSMLHLEMLQSKKHLVLPSNDIETVIPNLNRQVKVVKGPCKGKDGILLNVDIPNGVGTVYFSATEESQDFRFDDICKIHSFK